MFHVYIYDLRATREPLTFWDALAFKLAGPMRRHGRLVYAGD